MKAHDSIVSNSLNSDSTQIAKPDLVINFHMTESCNYSCSYCYAIWDDLEAKNELHRSSDKVESLLENLASYFLSENALKAKMGYENVRLNFAGGEPMLLGQRFLDAVTFASTLGFKTSLITNGHYLTDDVLNALAPSLDVLGISFDTASDDLASKIGRIDRKGRRFSADRLKSVSKRYRELNPQGVLKLNTVVNSVNCDDDLVSLMSDIRPDKWKLLRVLPVHGHQLTITQLQYQNYVQRHSSLEKIIVEEDNEAMTHSYLMINPEGRFYQNAEAGSGYLLSDSILDIGVEDALSQVPFDVSGFQQRYQLIPLVTVEEDLKPIKAPVKQIELKKEGDIPDYITQKAWREIDRLMSSKMRGRQWKKIHCDEGLVRFRLNLNFRLVVAIDKIHSGPYECMSHATFDKRYG